MSMSNPKYEGITKVIVGEIGELHRAYDLLGKMFVEASKNERCVGEEILKEVGSFFLKRDAKSSGE